MSYELKFEHPQFPEGREFGLFSLGVVENGGSLDIDGDQERLFIIQQGMTLEDAFKDNDMVTLTGSSDLNSEEVTKLLPDPQEDTENANAVSDNSGDSAGAVPNEGTSVIEQLERQHEGGELANG